MVQIQIKSKWRRLLIVFGLGVVLFSILYQLIAPLARIQNLNLEAERLILEGQYHESLVVADWAVFWSRLFIPKDNSWHAQASYLKAQSLRMLDKFKEAGILYQLAMKEQEAISGSDNRNYARMLHGLAELKYDTGKYDEAEFLYNQALEIQMRLLGPEHADTALSYNDLGVLYFVQSRYSEAQEFYQKSLKVRRKIFGEQHVDVAQSLCNLAVLYTQMGLVNEAEPLYEESLKTREALLPQNHPDIAYSLFGLASINFQRKNFAAATKQFERILIIWTKSYGEKHKDIAHVLANLGVIELGLGEYKRAEEHFLKSLAIRKELLGDRHHDVALTLMNLSELKIAQQRFDEAALLLSDTLKILEETFWGDHSEIEKTLQYLADVFNAKGEFGLALAQQERLLAKFQRTKKKQVAEYVNVLQAIAESHERLGQDAKAEIFYQRFIGALEEWFKADPVVLLAPTLKLSAILKRSQKFQEQQQLLENFAKKIKGEDQNQRFSMLKIYRELGLSHYDQENFKLSRRWFEKGLKSCLQHPEDSLDFQGLFEMLLGDVELKFKNYRSAKQHFIKAQKILTASSDDFAMQLLQLRFNLALIDHMQNSKSSAIEDIKTILVELQEKWGEDHPDALSPVLVLYQDALQRKDEILAEAFKSRILRIVEGMKARQPQFFEEYLKFARDFIADFNLRKIPFETLVLIIANELHPDEKENSF